MTEFSSKNTCSSENIPADSLTGIIFGVEGIRNSLVLLNGPMGCKFYHSTTSQFLMDRPPLYLPVTEGGKKVEVNYNYMNDWFFRQSRVPCTYLDHYDYVYGTAGKLEEGLRYIRDHVDFDLLTIVNSPGASLIGDNLKELAQKVLPDRRTVHIESPGYSETLSSGYEKASLEVLKQLAGEISERKSQRQKNSEQKNLYSLPDGKKVSRENAKKVNLLGLSIWHRYAQGDREELVRLLEMCGIQVNCCLFSGCSVDAILNITDADLNIVIHPDMAKETAEYLQDEYGMPMLLCQGPPIGFKAVENLFKEIGKILDADVEPVLAESRRSRGLAWYKLNGIYQACGLPKGVTFAVEGTMPVVLAMTGFLGDYLGMVPECLKCETAGPAFVKEKLEGLLARLRADDVEKKSIYDTKAELVFANANTISALMTRNTAFCGIEISLPGMGYTDILPKTQLGIRGTLFLIEQVINGLMSRL